MPLPDRIRIVEVGPRDGLQNEPGQIATATKLALIERLANAGLQTIEVGSFVSPKWVPQMADSADVLRAVVPRPGVSFPVLVPNMKGLEAAIAAGAREVAVFAAASEQFSQRNINCSIDESLDRFAPVVAHARDRDLKVRAYVSCVLGCPYQGEVAPKAVAAVARRLSQLGCYEISLGDTIGIGTPRAASAMLDTVLQEVPVAQVALHFHDTYGQALANLLACLELGVSVIDTAVAGLGGCPYAKGATGNVATEDVLYMLHGMGIATGVDLDATIDAAWFIADALGRPPASHLARARRGKPC